MAMRAGRPRRQRSPGISTRKQDASMQKPVHGPNAGPDAQQAQQMLLEAMSEQNVSKLQYIMPFANNFSVLEAPMGQSLLDFLQERQRWNSFQPLSSDMTEAPARRPPRKDPGANYLEAQVQKDMEVLLSRNKFEPSKALAEAKERVETKVTLQMNALLDANGRMKANRVDQKAVLDGKRRKSAVKIQAHARRNAAEKIVDAKRKAQQNKGVASAMIDMAKKQPGNESEAPGRSPRRGHSSPADTGLVANVESQVNSLLQALPLIREKLVSLEQRLGEVESTGHEGQIKRMLKDHEKRLKDSMTSTISAEFAKRSGDAQSTTHRGLQPADLQLPGLMQQLEEAWAGRAKEQEREARRWMQEAMTAREAELEQDRKEWLTMVVARQDGKTLERVEAALEQQQAWVLAELSKPGGGIQPLESGEQALGGSAASQQQKIEAHDEILERLEARLEDLAEQERKLEAQTAMLAEFEDHVEQRVGRRLQEQRDSIAAAMSTKSQDGNGTASASSGTHAERLERHSTAFELLDARFEEQQKWIADELAKQNITVGGSEIAGQSVSGIAAAHDAVQDQALQRLEAKMVRLAEQERKLEAQQQSLAEFEDQVETRVGRRLDEQDARVKDELAKQSSANIAPEVQAQVQRVFEPMHQELQGKLKEQEDKMHRHVEVGFTEQRTWMEAELSKQAKDQAMQLSSEIGKAIAAELSKIKSDAKAAVPSPGSVSSPLVAEAPCVDSAESSRPPVNQEQTTPAVPVYKIQDVEFLREQQLGQGAVGQVCKGSLRVDNDRPVAIKEYYGEEGAAAFALEVDCLSRLQHPNLVQMVGVVDDPSGKIVLLELLHSISQPPLQNHQRAIRDILSALVYIHGQKVVHLDIKPDNVMLEPSTGAVKLIDFSVGNNADGEHRGFVGSLPFVAPELLEVAPWKARPVDIYAVGVLIGYFLNLQSLFNNLGFSVQLNMADDATRNAALPEIQAAAAAFGRELKDTAGLGGDLAMQMLMVEAPRRPTAEHSLKHTWFA